MDRDREQKFEHLFERFVHPVHNFFSRRGFSVEDCEDLTQETLLGAYKGMERFRGDSSVETWLFTIAANVWRNEIRRRSTEMREAEELSLDRAGDVASPAKAGLLEEIVAREGQDLLREALGKLPPQMRRCLILRIHQERKYREIAVVMQVSINTVKSMLFQARERLREELAEHSGGGLSKIAGPEPVQPEEAGQLDPAMEV